MAKINLYPTKCNLCGGDVIYTTNDVIYGKKYGSGYCYLCTNCGANVGTHKLEPKKAFGILSNNEMKQMRLKCHHLFDDMWATNKERTFMYQKLANALGIDVSQCHFGYFDINMLNKAYEIIKVWLDD